MSLRPVNFEQLDYTSDHVRRGIKFEINGIIYQGFTWNVMYRCYSKSDNKWGNHSNNPLNCTEDKEQYERRKKKQIKKIESLLVKGHMFGFLQEADFLFPSLYVNDKTEWLFTSIAFIQGYFTATLNRLGYKYLSYESKEMAIIYNTNRLTPVLPSKKTYLRYKNQWEEKDLLFTCDFKDNYSNSIIKLGTIHGDFGTDYSESIPELLGGLKDSNVVIGGDFNHPPRYKMSCLQVKDENECTNFFSNYADIDGQYTKIELEDKRRGLSKAYDGFITTLDKIEIFGDHKWTKGVDKDGNEYPILCSTTSR